MDNLRENHGESFLVITPDVMDLFFGGGVRTVWYPQVYPSLLTVELFMNQMSLAMGEDLRRRKMRVFF